jgi:DNA invertase Pin-like site-specific DNA recombinase
MAGIGPDDWMKKATPFGYARISTDKQSVEDKRVDDPKKKTTIKRQIKEVNDALKAKGLPEIKPENFYAEVASGRRRDRPEWLKVRAAAMAHPGRAFMVVKDPSRWARNSNAAVIAWDPLMQREIPLYAASDGLQTGTATDIRPNELLLFQMASGFAANVSDVQSKKAGSGVKRQREEGAIAGKGTSLFPFASVDPLKVFQDNKKMLGEGRSGPANLKRAIGLISNPNGMKAQSSVNLFNREKARRENLTPSKYNEWRDFRERMRQRLIRLDSDPWASGGNKNGKLDYKANALLRMSGNYLKSPWMFEMPTEDFLNEVELNFPQYLSDKDKKRRGKRRL